MTSLVLKSATSGRLYRLSLNNLGRLSLAYVPSGLTDQSVTLLKDRALVNTARSAAFVFGVKDTDLANPLVVLTQLDNIHIASAYLILESPNRREWEVTCTQSGVYRIYALSSEWPRAQRPIVSDPAGVPWRFEVDAAGQFQVTSDPAELHRRNCTILSIDGSTAFRLDVNTDGILSPTEVSRDGVRFYDAELVAPTGERWLLRVTSEGILYTDSEWQEAVNRPDDEWTVLIAERTGQLYVVDPRVPPPGASGARRVVNGYW